jgi:hypothetical protein
MQLYKQLGDNGLIWADGKANNVYFYGSPEAPSVGILDPDMIFPGNEFDVQPRVVGQNLMAGATDAMQRTLADHQFDSAELKASDVMRDRFVKQFPIQSGTQMPLSD